MGGITQQIWATYFKKKTLLAQTVRLNEKEEFKLTLLGMLVIDTPVTSCSQTCIQGAAHSATWPYSW